MLDVLLLVAAVWFAIVGYRQGFVVGILSVAGFLGGGLVAVYLLPVVLNRYAGAQTSGVAASIVVIVVVLVAASVGQAITTHYGNQMRRHITGQPARVLDAAGGALVHVVSMLLVAWLIGSALAYTSLPTVARQVRSSAVLGEVSRILPEQADRWFGDFNSVLARSGFPQVFAPFQNEPITSVPPPDPKLTSSPTVARARQSIVKVVGTATSCSKILEGTGFVFAPQRVMTNAHVVGGVDEPTVQVGGEGRPYDATVVLYDWRRDIAVLDVPQLNAPALNFAGDAHTGDGAIVAGFPENGGFDVRAARLRERIQATGPDIYNEGTVHRDVYSLYANVRQGNSGGPLLTPDGKVYGVIFAKSLDHDQTGYALTADEVRGDAQAGTKAEQEVDSRGCALS